MALVAGVDSSTQACKVVVCDALSGAVVRRGVASHPAGTETDPDAWWSALQTAITAAGGLADVDALAVGGQQHGMVCLDGDGDVIRPALLWNDTRSAAAADGLVAELGDGDATLGARRWAESVGSVPVASFTITKLRWLADHEPENASRVAAVALPHDWLTWRLSGAASLDTLVTDRSDASGTGYWSSDAGYRRDLLALALRWAEGAVERVVLPRVLGPHEPAGRAPQGVVLGPGCGDNAGAALGLGLSAGETFVSIGTSGVVAGVSATPTHDRTGGVAGFADATGAFLPLVCTLNGSRILDATRRLLGVGHEELSDLALATPDGADGLVLVPYLEGERTPNLPEATGSLYGLTPATMSPGHLARAGVEGLLCLLADAVDVLRRHGVTVDHLTLVGGGAQSRAVREIAPRVFGLPVAVPPPGEYVAVGAARQAAWTLSGEPEPPSWKPAGTTLLPAAPVPGILTRYREVAAGAAFDRDPTQPSGAPPALSTTP
jgi:xylulokinase